MGDIIFRMVTVANINHAHTWALGYKNFHKAFLKHVFFFRLRSVILELRFVSI